MALPRWRSLCHSLARDQPQPGSFFQRPREAEKRDPGNEVASSDARATYDLRLRISRSHGQGRSCCFESFFPLFFPADFRAKERLLAVYIRVRFDPCLAGYFRKRGIGEKRRSRSNAGLNRLRKQLSFLLPAQLRPS